MHRSIIELQTSRQAQNQYRRLYGDRPTVGSVALSVVADCADVSRSVLIDVIELVRTVFSGLSAMVIEDVEDTGQVICAHPDQVMPFTYPEPSAVAMSRAREDSMSVPPSGPVQVSAGNVQTLTAATGRAAGEAAACAWWWTPARGPGPKQTGQVHGTVAPQAQVQLGKWRSPIPAALVTAAAAALGTSALRRAAERRWPGCPGAPGPALRGFQSQRSTVMPAVAHAGGVCSVVTRTHRCGSGGLVRP